MSIIRRVYYVPSSAEDAYGQWKSSLRLGSQAEGSSTRHAILLRDVQNKEVHWLGRWGPAHFDGKADFIPAQGGCIVYLNLDGTGMISRVLLAALRALARDALPLRYTFLGSPRRLI